MCCRYLLLQETLAAVAEALAAEMAGEWASRYNVAPGRAIPAVRSQPRAGRREVTALHWGLAPERGDHTGAAALINARAEGLADKPAFRAAFRARRCLIPASGFYEWSASGRRRQPHLFRLRDGSPFCLAGLWESRTAPDGSARDSCAIITTAPNELMRPIHHRMPAILPRAAWNLWLDPAANDPRALAPWLRPFPADAMTVLAVGQRVNNVRHDDPACLEPASAVEMSGDPAQLSLEL